VGYGREVFCVGGEKRFALLVHHMAKDGREWSDQRKVCPILYSEIDSGRGGARLAFKNRPRKPASFRDSRPRVRETGWVVRGKKKF